MVLSQSTPAGTERVTEGFPELEHTGSFTLLSYMTFEIVFNGKRHECGPS